MATKNNSTDLIGVLEPYFTKQAPFQIPENGRKMIVEWLPWINVILGILLLPAVLLVLGLGGAVGILAASVGQFTGPLYWLSMVMLVVTVAMLFVTFPGLKARRLSTWKLVFWADIAYFLYNVISGLGNPLNLVGSLVSGLLSLIVGLYILFQIKSHYK